MTTLSSTFDSLTRCCVENPDRDRMTFLDENGNVEVVNGAELVSRAKQISRALRTKVGPDQEAIAVPGDRVLLAYPAGIDFVVGFLGCLHAGLIPVPVTYPKPRRTLSRYSRIAEDAQATVALTSDSMLQLIDPVTLSSNQENQIPWHSERTLKANLGDDFEVVDAVPRSGDDVVFLQYTSGSTNDPKGVMITHNNVLANLDAINEGFQIDHLPVEKRVVCSWLPAYHDMGLVGVILSSLIHDGHAVMMSPTSFVTNPARWLQAISDYSATVTVAPSFGYQWAATKISDADLNETSIDLSSLQLAACGAEPIHLSVLEQFADRFASLGFRHKTFYPCYGLAESTLMVTGTSRLSTDSSENTAASDDLVENLPGPVTISISRNQQKNNRAAEPESTIDTINVVSSGIAGKNTRLRIIDAGSGSLCPENQIGEIQIQSPSVAAGYWNDPKQTQEVFLDDKDGRFLRTGDLGFLSKGHLYVTGRLKDLIIIGGQNHYPQDIERSIGQSHPRLAEALGATFSVIDDQVEKLIVVQEVPRGISGEESDDILRAIRVAIAQGHDLAVQEIVLIRPTTLPRTSSGKVQRQRCRQLYLEHELNVVFDWRHTDALDPALFPEISDLLQPPQNAMRIRNAIESTLTSWLAQHLEADEIRSDQSFAELGVDSLLAVELSQQLERWLGVQLSPVAAWSYPTPHSLAEHLCSLLIEADEAEEEIATNRDYAELLDQIADMDEDEVDELLRHMN